MGDVHFGNGFDGSQRLKVRSAHSQLWGQGSPPPQNSLTRSQDCTKLRQRHKGQPTFGTTPSTQRTKDKAFGPPSSPPLSCHGGPTKLWAAFPHPHWYFSPIIMEDGFQIISGEGILERLLLVPPKMGLRGLGESAAVRCLHTEDLGLIHGTKHCLAKNHS